LSGLSVGRVITGFHVVKRLAVGADLCASARGMMFALGCIQALRCNSNHCPVGITTQRRELVAGLHVPSKTDRVFHYHRRTVESVAEIIGAMGFSSTEQLRPWNVLRRTSARDVHHYGECYRYLKPGELLGESIPEDYRRAWEVCTHETFDHVGPE
jgi:hypothetical protein